MEFEEIKQQSNLKVLFRGKSGRGKTYLSCKIVLALSKEGVNVKYVDTEAEGSTTIVQIVEDPETEFTEGDVENIEYVQASGFDTLREEISHSEQKKYDVLVLDTLDHKNAYALRKLVSEDEEKDEDRAQSEADWNQWLATYDLERVLMETINKPKCNIIATLDPESGKMDKPKGAQTNCHGYFTVVVDLTKSGDGWGNKVRNWVGNPKGVIGHSANNITEAIVKEIEGRS